MTCSIWQSNWRELYFDYVFPSRVGVGSKQLSVSITQKCTEVNGPLVWIQWGTNQTANLPNYEEN